MEKIVCSFSGIRCFIFILYEYIYDTKLNVLVIQQFVPTYIIILSFLTKLTTVSIFNRFSFRMLTRINVFHNSSNN